MLRNLKKYFVCTICIVMRVKGLNLQQYCILLDICKELRYQVWNKKQIKIVKISPQNFEELRSLFFNFLSPSDLRITEELNVSMMMGIRVN